MPEQRTAPQAGPGPAAPGPARAGGLEIAATGRAVPGRVITNDDMARVVDTSDEWIASRTGIRQRYFCAEGQSAFTLARDAAAQALARAGLSPADIGLCLCASFTADNATPSLACQVHGALGLGEECPAFDVNAACTGFLTALETARCMLAASALAAPWALVIGAECISRVLDMADRSTCVLFGDGAGAAVVRLSAAHPYWSCLGARGDGALLHAGGTASADRFLHMQGQAVFRFAADIIPRTVARLLAEAGLTLADIDCVVCHQANGRIIDHAAKKLGARPGQFYKNMDRYANTSAASIPIALDELARGGRLAPGARVLCVGFGAGLTWGGALLTL